MSSFVPNSSQAEFISELGKNILVSASAGSGKTSSMVEKIVSIIDRGVSLDNMLIVTYTVASANEMRQKLYRSLMEKMRDCDETKRTFFQAQLETLNNCDIGTIHSFCKKVITKYFYVVNQDLNYGILEKSDYLFDKAVNAVFRKYISSDDENFFTLYDSYNKKRNEKILLGVVRTLHGFFASKVDSTEWKKYVIDNSYNEDISKNICANYILNCFKNRGLIIKDNLEKLKNIYVSDKIGICIDNRIAFVDNILNCNDYNAMLKCVDYEIVRKEPTTKLGAEYAEWVEEYEIVIELFKKYREDIQKLNAFTSDKNEIRTIKNLLVTLFEVVDSVDEKYNEYKKEKNLLDFSDLEHKCFDILNSSSEICDELRQNYKYIFVDEYQDINELQESIINKIKDKTNLNLIGDVKQSIFAFRLATPKLFVEKYNNYPSDPNSRVINFNENWRSENSILMFVNEICNAVITKNTIGVDYKKDANLKYPDKKEKGEPCVEINLIDKAKPDEDDDQSYVRKEALLVAKKIVDLTHKTYNVDGKQVSYTFGDIAILLRKKGELMEEIVRVLKEYNIPCNVSYKLDIFAFHPVQVLYAVLKLMNNNDDDLSCAIVLKNLFGLNENDLAKIKNISNDSLNICCDSYCSKDDIYEKLAKYKMFLSDLKFQMSYMTLSEIIKSVADKYLLIECMRKDGEENKAYIDNFIGLIDNNLYKYDIKSCIDYLSSIEGSGIDVGFDNGNGVQITTIHSSKGLEYKAVIFAGLGQRLSINLNTNDIVISDNFGVGLQYLDVENRIKKDSVIKKACLLDKEREEVNEELRLLYVALTRGMRYLILTGAYPIKDVYSKSKKDIYSCRRFFDWIFMSLSTLDRKKFESDNKAFTIFDGKESVAKVTIDEFAFMETDRKDVRFAKPQSDVVNEIRKNISWKYGFGGSTKISLKNSVSGLLKDSLDYEHSVDSFKELTLTEKLTPSESIEKGNAYHLVMQNIDFDKNQNFADLIDSLKVSKLVSVDKIQKCVDTIKCFATNAKVHKEAQFLMKVRHCDIVEGGSKQKILVQGTIDLYIEDGDEITLIDYKTNRVGDLVTLAKMYSTQMRLYALALEKYAKKPVKNVYLYSFDRDKLVDMAPYIKMKN